MNKIIIKESDIKLIITKIINEAIDSEFTLTTPDMKLEFLITRITDLINDMENENDGSSVYYCNRLKHLIDIASK